MNSPVAYRWDYEQNPRDGDGDAITFSVGVFQWLPKTSGAGLKKSKSIRVKGYVAEHERVYRKAEQLCPRRWACFHSMWLDWRTITLLQQQASSQFAATNTRKQCSAAFKPAFKDAEFKKYSTTWNRFNPDTIEAFNIECSQWSERYYFNVGIYIRSLGNKTRVLEYDCHVRDRIPIATEEKSIIERYRNLASFDSPTSVQEADAGPDLDPETKIAELSKLITPMALTWLDKLSDLKRLREYLIESKLPNGNYPYWVTRSTLELFGI